MKIIKNLSLEVADKWQKWPIIDQHDFAPEAYREDMTQILVLMLLLGESPPVKRKPRREIPIHSLVASIERSMRNLNSCGFSHRIFLAFVTVSVHSF